jgi:hypothetical protein
MPKAFLDVAEVMGMVGSCEFRTMPCVKAGFSDGFSDCNAHLRVFTWRPYDKLRPEDRPPPNGKDRQSL